MPTAYEGLEIEDNEIAQAAIQFIVKTYGKTEPQEVLPIILAMEDFAIDELATSLDKMNETASTISDEQVKSEATVLLNGLDDMIDEYDLPKSKDNGKWDSDINLKCICSRMDQANGIITRYLGDAEE